MILVTHFIYLCVHVGYSVSPPIQSDVAAHHLQVLTAPLRPKLITTSSASRPPVPVSSAAQSIIVNRSGARLMIPRASIGQLYVPTGSAAGGGLTSTPLTSMMVIPGGLATATNGTTTTVVTYPAGSSAAKTPLKPAATAEVGPVSAAVDRLAHEVG